eukprot:gene9633-12971_t
MNVLRVQLLITLFIYFNKCILFIKSDTLYYEGFNDYANLPGGYNDKRNISTLPVGTDTNRYADGFTSTSAQETTSPHFPYYRGSSANVSDRYLRYTRYMLSAAEQGIAGYGDGDEVRESARLKIINQPGYENFPKPNKTFTVYAAIKWNPSDFAVQEGETYNITVFGSDQGYSSQFWYDGGLRVNSEGYSSYFDAVSNCYVGMGRCRPHLKKKRRLPDANWMSLCCSIGQFVRPLTEVEPGKEEQYRWMPLDEATLQETIFHVGQSVEFRAVYTGQLICFANDAHTLYWNNVGSLDVTVTRVSWPPKNETTYLAKKLPACDSAQVVYQYLQSENKTYPECNPNGGGSGWKKANIDSTTGSYGSGAPKSVLNS